MAMMPFIFGGDTNMSLEELRRRQAAAAAVAGQKRKFPTTLGEGMTYLGEAVGDRLENDRLREAEAAQAALDRGAPVRPDSYRGGGAAVAPPRAAAPVGVRVPTERIAPDAAPTGAVPGAAPVVPGGLAEGATDPLDRITAALLTSPQEVAQMDPTVGAAVPPPGSPSDDEGMWSARQAAIGGIESSDDYDAQGVQTKYGRAQGRYGVMEVNVGPWTQAALGKAMTPAEFRADKEAQDAVFRHRFGQYVAKYGEEKAARAWYGGEGNINNLDITDAHEKLSVHDYGQDYINRLMKRQRRSSAEEPDATSAPIRLAALGGPSGTMTDAPPIGMGGSQLALSKRMPANEKPPLPTYLTPRAPEPPQPPVQPPPPQQRMNLAPSDVENPDQPTVTGDINPMSVAPNQLAQVGSEMFNPRRMSDVAPLPAAPRAPPGTVVTDIKPAPNLPPSRAPIPGAKEQEMSDPGPKPERPGRLGPSPAAVDNWKIWNDPRYSEQRRARAKEAYQEEERFRLEIQNQQQETYKDERERWQVLRDAKDKFDREAHDRLIDQSIKLHGLEKTRQDMGLTTVQIQEALGRVEKQEYERTTQRQQEEQQRGLNIAKSQQEVQAGKAPPHITNEGQLLIWDQDSRTYKARPPDPPGEGQPNIKLSETQAKTFDNLQKADIAHEQYKRIPNADQVLAQGLQDELAGKIPFFGNAALSSRYRRARNAALNVVTAHLRETSGAVIAPSEEASHIANMFPKYGDDPAILKQKAEIREGVVTGMKFKLGTAGPLADYAARKRQETDAAEQAKLRDEMKGVGTPVIGKVYKNGNKRRYWTGSRWEDD